MLYAFFWVIPRRLKVIWCIYTGLFISPSGISDPCGTVAGMVTPKGSMSTEGETLQVSLLTYRCSICAPLVTWQMSILFQSGSCDTRCNAYEDGTECSETSAYKIQTPRNFLVLIDIQITTIQTLSELSEIFGSGTTLSSYEYFVKNSDFLAKNT
jgi:hypothetical protein